jgi:hypothetical protein
MNVSIMNKCNIEIIFFQMKKLQDNN